MIDWTGVIFGRIDITVNDITSSTPSPWPIVNSPTTNIRSRSAWFYFGPGKLVQASISDDRLEIEITDGGITSSYSVEITLDDKPVKLRWQVPIVGGWCNNNVRGLSEIAKLCTKRVYGSRLVSTTDPVRETQTLRFILVVMVGRYMVVLEFVWDGCLAITHVHTQGRRSTLYYLTTQGYCSIQHRSGKHPGLLIESPSGESHLISVNTNVSYDDLWINQYGLLHRKKTFFLRWHDFKYTDLNDDLEYVLSDNHLLWQESGNINIVDTIAGTKLSVKSDLSPMAYDAEYYTVFAKAKDGVVLYRINTSMSTYHLSDIFINWIASGDSAIVEQRLNETVECAWRKLSFMSYSVVQRILANPVSKQLVDSVIRSKMEGVYVWQWIPEMHLFAICYKLFNDYHTRVYTLAADID